MVTEDPDDPAATDESRTDTDAAPTAVPKSTYKVKGEFGAIDGAAVLGVNNATDGTPIGVEGVTDGDSYDSAGVRGTALRGGGHGVWAESETYNGLRAISHSTSMAGIFATNTATSGTTFGLYGENRTPGGAAIYASANDADGTGLQSNGDVEVTGTVSTSVVGARLQLSSDQQVPDSGFHDVAFDTLPTDHFGGSLSNGRYSISGGGSYHVEVQVMWDSALPSGSVVDLTFTVDGDIEQSARWEGDNIRTHNFGFTTFDRTDPYFGLEVRQYSGTDSAHYIDSDYQSTYVTIHKVG